MTKGVFTMGAKEREVVAQWYINKPATSLSEARALVVIKAALDEINYDFKVAEGEVYTDMELVLYTAYRVAIGECKLKDVFDDLNLKIGCSLFKITRKSDGFEFVAV